MSGWFSSALGALDTWWRQVLLLDLSPSRRSAYLCFAGAQLVALASHTFVGPVKVAIFMDVVGRSTEPVAKSLVLVVLVPVLALYGVTISMVSSPQRLVAYVCGFFAALFTLVTVVHIASGGHPPKWLAWVLYYAVETKGVIVMPMLWSVVADFTTSELAKKTYPAIFFIVQLGGILGSMMAIQVNGLGGEAGLLLMQAVSFLLMVVLASLGCRLSVDASKEDGIVVQPSASTSATSDDPLQLKQKRNDDVASKDISSLGSFWLGVQQQVFQGFEGLWLLLSRSYVFMTFWVSYANLMPRTVLDYQNSVLGVEMYNTREAQIAFFGQVNMYVNLGTALLTLIGTRPIVAALGVGRTLVVLPIIMLGSILALCFKYTLGMSTAVLVLSCIVAYGLNSPCKEMLYIHTSKDIKYKAKSWSEMYGNQIMKLLGAQMNLWVNREADICAPHCFQQRTTAVVASVWVSLWIWVALALASQHRQLEATNGVVT